jgi:Tol biopolymer transport system component
MAPPGGTPDLYVAWRLSTADRFSLPTPLTDLNTAADERDPWLSPDGTVFFFTSDRAPSGTLQIYEVPAHRQPR